MSDAQHSYVSQHYAPRAADYVTSAVHASGADLDQIEAVVRSRGAARVLDLGCGGGHVSYRAAPHASEVVAYDLTPTMLEQVQATADAKGLRNITVQQGPAERLPFPDACFDVVLSRFSTHHWRDAGAGLREARRVLKADGQAVFADSIAPAHPLLDTHLQAVELLRDPSHVRNYTLAEWIGALSRSGFAVTGVTGRKLRMEFEVWTKRTATPTVFVEALRALQAGASAPVREHFAIGTDGSFDLDTVVMECGPALA